MEVRIGKPFELYVNCNGCHAHNFGPNPDHTIKDVAIGFEQPSIMRLCKACRVALLDALVNDLTERSPV
jgi:hypothetical protein